MEGRKRWILASQIYLVEFERGRKQIGAAGRGLVPNLPCGIWTSQIRRYSASYLIVPNLPCGIWTGWMLCRLASARNRSQIYLVEFEHLVAFYFKYHCYVPNLPCGIWTGRGCEGRGGVSMSPKSTLWNLNVFVWEAGDRLSPFQVPNLPCGIWTKVRGWGKDGVAEVPNLPCGIWTHPWETGRDIRDIVPNLPCGIWTQRVRPVGRFRAASSQIYLVEFELLH